MLSAAFRTQAAREGEASERLREELREEAQAERGQKLVLSGLKAAENGGKDDPDVELPFSVSQELQAHQRVGVQFMWDNMVLKGQGAILAHCMGLGKTLQAIAVVQAAWMRASARKERLAVLIVAPVNTLSNWSAEFKQWLPRDENTPPIWSMGDPDAGRTNLERVKHLEAWYEEGGVMLIGYDAYRNMSTGVHIKGKGCAAHSRCCSRLDP